MLLKVDLNKFDYFCSYMKQWIQITIFTVNYFTHKYADYQKDEIYVRFSNFEKDFWYILQ